MAEDLLLYSTNKFSFIAPTGVATALFDGLPVFQNSLICVCVCVLYGTQPDATEEECRQPGTEGRAKQVVFLAE